MSPSPLSGQKMPFFKVKFEPAFNDFTVPTTMSKKRSSESRYKPRSQFDSCQTLCPIPASRAVETLLYSIVEFKRCFSSQGGMGPFGVVETKIIPQSLPGHRD